MKEDKIYGTSVELYAAVQLLGRDLYVLPQVWGAPSQMAQIPMQEKGLCEGRQSIYLDNRFGMGTDGHFDYVHCT